MAKYAIMEFSLSFSVTKLPLPREDNKKTLPGKNFSHQTSSSNGIIKSISTSNGIPASEQDFPSSRHFRDVSLFVSLKQLTQSCSKQIQTGKDTSSEHLGAGLTYRFAQNNSDRSLRAKAILLLQKITRSSQAPIHLVLTPSVNETTKTTPEVNRNSLSIGSLSPSEYERTAKDIWRRLLNNTRIANENDKDAFMPCLTGRNIQMCEIPPSQRHKIVPFRFGIKRLSQRERQPNSLSFTTKHKENNETDRSSRRITNTPETVSRINDI